MTATLCSILIQLEPLMLVRSPSYQPMASTYLRDVIQILTRLFRLVFSMLGAQHAERSSLVGAQPDLPVAHYKCQTYYVFLLSSVYPLLLRYHKYDIYNETDEMRLSKIVVRRNLDGFNHIQNNLG